MKLIQTGKNKVEVTLAEYYLLCAELTEQEWAEAHETQCNATVRKGLKRSFLVQKLEVVKYQ